MRLPRGSLHAPATQIPEPVRDRSCLEPQGLESLYNPRRRHGEANPDALAEIEALPRTVVTANGSTVREESAGSPREGTN